MLLRPLVRAVKGGWVRAGASWRELEHGWAVYGRPAPDAAHREEALLALHDAHQAGGRGRYLAAEQPVHLDEVGPAEAPVVRLSTTESGERDWHDLGVTVSGAGEDVPFEPLFVALSRGDGHLALDSGTWFAIDRPELAQPRGLVEEARELQDRPAAGLRFSASASATATTPCSSSASRPAVWG